MTKKQSFATQLTVLGETFGRQLTDPAIEGYWMVLQALTIEQLTAATQRALRECSFMPAPGQLLDLAGVSAKADALIAWDAVRAALRKHSYTVGVDFGPLVNAVIRAMGGWRALDAKESAYLDTWGTKEFERVYALYSVKDVATLKGSAFMGPYGGVPVRIAIAGVTPMRQIANSEANGVSAHIRDLANSKSTNDNPKETR